MRREISISAVAFREGESWVIQGIEYDIAAHAAEITNLPTAFMRAVAENACITEHLGREPLAGIKAAPDRFRTMFEQATTRIGFVSPPEKLENAPIGAMDIRLAEHA